MSTEEVGMIQVIAIAQGFDGLSLREPGEVFDMPEDVFEPRPKLNEKGEPITNQFYEPPSWFEPVDKSMKAKIDEQRRTTRKGARVPAIDPIRQQADSTAEGRLRAQAEAAVREEFRAKDEEDIRKAVDKKFAELKARSGDRHAGSDPRDTRGADVRTADARTATIPSGEALDRSAQPDTTKPAKKP